MGKKQGLLCRYCLKCLQCLQKVLWKLLRQDEKQAPRMMQAAGVAALGLVQVQQLRKLLQKLLWKVLQPFHQEALERWQWTAAAATAVVVGPGAAP